MSAPKLHRSVYVSQKPTDMIEGVREIQIGFYDPDNGGGPDSYIEISVYELLRLREAIDKLLPRVP